MYTCGGGEWEKIEDNGDLAKTVVAYTQTSKLVFCVFWCRNGDPQPRRIPISGTCQAPNQKND